MLTCLEKERPNIRQTRSAQGDRVWQLNLYKNDLNFRACIRDEQHTTVVGGKAYAEIIFAALKTLLKGGTLPRDEGEEVSFRTSDTTYPPVGLRSINGDFGPGTQIIITLPPSSKQRKITVFSKLFKGPETAQLQVDAGGQHHIIDTWNRYTYYIHGWSTFGALSPELDLAPGDDTITITVTPNIPDYEMLAKGLEKPLSYMKKIAPHIKMLRLTGGIYLLGADDFELDIKENRERI